MTGDAKRSYTPLPVDQPGPCSRSPRARRRGTRARVDFQIAALPTPDRYRALGDFPPTTSMYGTFCSWASRILPDFLLPVVEAHPQPLGRQRRLHLGGIRRVTVRNRQHHRLQRRQPGAERAREVLDQQRDELLEAAEDRPMNHHGPVFGCCRPRCRRGRTAPASDSRAGSSHTATCGRSRRSRRSRSSGRRTRPSPSLTEKASPPRRAPT